jgi:tRNA threonylcarbamoyl adenosine modification protein (Sua5/YciO/YrdC/YwlC family)
LKNKKAIESLARLKDVKVKKANFSIVFYDLSQLAEYTRHVDRPTYKILNKNLPGPFTFILEASPQIPKLFDSNRKTIGIRIPENNIAMELVQALGHPLVTTSVHDEDEILEYSTDPEVISETWGKKVDVVINGGPGNNIASTVIDLSNGKVSIVREGAGELIF